MYGSAVNRRVISLLVFGWTALVVAGRAPAQAISNSPSAICSADAEDQKAEAREVDCLRQLGPEASRKGEQLTLKIENGTSKTYEDNPKACAADDAKNCILHSLVGYEPAARVYSVLIRYYEGSNIDLVSARTGNVLKVGGEPHFSADGSRFLVIDNDLAYGGPYNLAVGSTTNGSLKLDWQRAHADEGEPMEWHLQRWIDDDHIALRVFPADTAPNCPDNDCEAILTRFDSGWAVRRLPAKQQ